MNDRDYEVIVRVAGGILAPVIWGLSIYFSAQGFGFQIDINNMIWVGYLLGLLGTYMQIVFGRQAGRMTMSVWLAGLLAYVYGIYTNFIGIVGMREDGAGIFLPLVVALIIEILPEPILAYALTGSWVGGDLFQAVFTFPAMLSRAISGKQPPQTYYNKPHPRQQGGKPKGGKPQGQQQGQRFRTPTPQQQQPHGPRPQWNPPTQGQYGPNNVPDFLKRRN